MTYSQGGLIQATDYNNLVGSNPTTTSTAFNAVWSTGNGIKGWGQTAIAQSAASASLVTATQWASLINALNSANTHVNGSGSGITAVTSGSTIAYLSTLQTAINGLYTDANKFASNAAVTVGSSSTTAWTSATTTATLTRAFGARAAFASADQARWFFNAGGRLKLNCSGTQNASTTGRTNDIISMLGFLGGVGLFGANTNAGRTGTGGTLNTNDTTKGYHTTTYNANVTLVSITSTTAAYTSDTATITVNCNGTQGSNNDKGLNVDFWITLNSTQGTGALSFNDSIGVNVIRSIDVSYPETTNLTNSWGTVTITAL